MAGLFTTDNVQMDYTSPLFNILHTIIMEGLEREDAELMVTEPVKPLDLKFDDGSLEFILGKSRPTILRYLGSSDLYQVNPTYLPRDLQMLCHYTFQAHNPESTLVTIDEAVRGHQQVTSESNAYNATRWAAFPAEVKSGLCKLAGHKDNPDSRMLEKSERQAFDRLALMTRNRRTVFVSEMFMDWINNNFSYCKDSF